MTLNTDQPFITEQDLLCSKLTMGNAASFSVAMCPESRYLFKFKNFVLFLVDFGPVANPAKH